MKKRIFSLLMVTVMIFSCFSMVGYAAEYAVGDSVVTDTNAEPTVTIPEGTYWTGPVPFEDLVCQLDEHSHNNDCYACAHECDENCLEEDCKHECGDECRNLVCTHEAHGDDCYEPNCKHNNHSGGPNGCLEMVLVCNNNDYWHQHGMNCWKWVCNHKCGDDCRDLVCEHEAHGDNCYVPDCKHECGDDCYKEACKHNHSEAADCRVADCKHVCDEACFAPDCKHTECTLECSPLVCTHGEEHGDGCYVCKHSVGQHDNYCKIYTCGHRYGYQHNESCAFVCNHVNHFYCYVLNCEHNGHVDACYAACNHQCDEKCTSNVCVHECDANCDKLVEEHEEHKHGADCYATKYRWTLALKTFTVTWVDEDGTTLETDENVPYGTVPKFDGAEPTKKATAQHTYKFAGWEKVVEVEAVAAEEGDAEATLDRVNGDVTYKATYSSEVNKYTVTWFDEDGKTVLEKDENVEYGAKPEFNGTEPTKAADDKYTYKFAGWVKVEAATAQAEEAEAEDVVTGDVAYKATYTATEIPAAPEAPATPETGDNSNAGMYFGMMLAAFAGFVALRKRGAQN